jgi:hypothetical protein
VNRVSATSRKEVKKQGKEGARSGGIALGEDLVVVMDIELRRTLHSLSWTTI